MATEERIAKVEGSLNQMDKRLNHISEDMRELRKDIKNNLKWTLWILIPMWATIIASIFGSTYMLISALIK